MTKKLERELLINTIKKALELNIENCEFMKKVYKGNKKALETFNKSIRQCKKALKIVENIKHFDILRSCYGDIVGCISGQLMLGGTLISSNVLKKWDTTEKGYKEFKEKQEQNQKMLAERIKKQQENAKAIENARKQGKKVEMFYDPIDKQVKPVIVEEENKA